MNELWNDIEASEQTNAWPKENREGNLPDQDVNRGNPAEAGNKLASLSSGIVAIIWPMNPGHQERKIDVT